MFPAGLQPLFHSLINDGAVLLFNGNPGIIGNMLPGAGNGIEDRCLTCIGIPGKGDCDLVFHMHNPDKPER